MRFWLISNTDPNESQESNLLSVEEQKLSILLSHIFNVHLGARGKGYVDTITLSQLDGIVTDGDLDRSASGCTSVVTRPLDEMGIDICVLGNVGKGSGGREDCSEDVEWRVHRRRASGLALINDL